MSGREEGYRGREKGARPPPDIFSFFRRRMEAKGKTPRSHENAKSFSSAPTTQAKVDSLECYFPTFIGNRGSPIETEILHALKKGAY
jgi:hypothetical protein